jgi:hypothetical protein
LLACEIGDQSCDPYLLGNAEAQQVAKMRSIRCSQSDEGRCSTTAN